MLKQWHMIMANSSEFLAGILHAGGIQQAALNGELLQNHLQGFHLCTAGMKTIIFIQ